MSVVMKADEKSGDARESPIASWNFLYGAGAVSAFACVLLILIPLVLLVVQPQAPLGGGAAILEYIAAHKAVYLTELVCFVGLSLPAIFVFLALGAALWRRGRSLALIGAVTGVGSELIALALGSSPPSLNGGLVLLSAQYQAASDVLRPSLAAAADALAAYANAVSAAGILTALGILVLSIAMSRGGFPKWVGEAEFLGDSFAVGALLIAPRVRKPMSYRIQEFITRGSAEPVAALRAPPIARLPLPAASSALRACGGFRHPHSLPVEERRPDRQSRALACHFTITRPATSVPAAACGP